MELPFNARRWALLTNRSTIASAKVGSPAASAVCQFSTGNWLTTTVERTWLRSSITSQQVLGFDDAGRGQQKIVQYQHADLGQVRQTPHIASVTAAERQIRQQPRCAHVQRRVTTTNGGVGQRATDE